MWTKRFSAEQMIRVLKQAELECLWRRRFVKQDSANRRSTAVEVVSIHGLSLRMRIREIAQTRVRYGYCKIRVLLNREAWEVGIILCTRCTRKKGSH